MLQVRKCSYTLSTILICFYNAPKRDLDRSEGNELSRDGEGFHLKKDLILKGVSFVSALFVHAAKWSGGTPRRQTTEEAALSLMTGWAVAARAGDPRDVESTPMQLRPRGGRSNGGENKQGGCKEGQTLLAGKPNQALEPNRLEVMQTLHCDVNLCPQLFSGYVLVEKPEGSSAR